MISNAPIVAPIADGSNRAPLSWVTWFVQIAQALNSILYSAWKNWTPTVTGSGSMTVTSSSIVDATYFQVGANVTVHCKLQVTFGGTASSWGVVTPPVNQVGNWQGIAANATGSGIPWQPILGLVQGSQIQFYAPNGGSWPLGSQITVDLSGVYRCL